MPSPPFHAVIQIPKFLWSPLIDRYALPWPSVIGGLAGGVWMVKIGINRALWLFGVAQAVAILYVAAGSTRFTQCATRATWVA